MINFLVEISNLLEKIINSTPYHRYKKGCIYEIDMRKTPKKSYWTDWGGVYDNYINTQIALYFDGFLRPVNNYEDLKKVVNSIYIQSVMNILDGGLASDKIFNSIDDIEDDIVDGGEANSDFISDNERIALFHIPKHPWFYPDYKVEYNDLIPFLNTSLDSENPSYNKLRDINTQIKFNTPNFSYKLSDNIAGITLNQDFSVSLINNDGYFDDEKKWNLFNTPIYIRKAIIDNPKYSDFKQINTGFVNSLNINFDKIQINASDKLYSMNMPACEIITKEKYPSISIDEKNIGKNIPIIYGTKKVKLQKLNNESPYYYVGAEKVNKIITAWNKDDEIITGCEIENNMIKSTVEIDSALITGYIDNTIGKIIIDLISRKARNTYIVSFWNVEETDKYLKTSPEINICINSGDVNKAVQAVLKNDLAFLIQQIDGRLTIRKYGETYNIPHIIKPEMITKKPEKNWNDASNNYFSSCVINYNYIDDDIYDTYLYNERENELENTYRKLHTRTFDTDLVNLDDVKKLAVLLSDRYSGMKQILKIAVGFDTSDYVLLDTITIETHINERNFNKLTNYLLKEINPAQDLLVLEEL